MSVNQQLIEMIDTIDDTEKYLRKRCAAGTAAQSVQLFEDLSSLIDMIHQRFRNKGVLPPYPPQFRTLDASQTAEMFLDEVVRWEEQVRKRIKQKEVLKELTRGSLLDAIAAEGKPFVETARALRAMKPKAEDTGTQIAGEEMARRAFTDALSKSPAAAALRKEGGIPPMPESPVKPVDMPDRSMIPEPEGRIGGRPAARPMDDDELIPKSQIPLQTKPEPIEHKTPRQRRAEQLSGLKTEIPRTPADKARPVENSLPEEKEKPIPVESSTNGQEESYQTGWKTESRPMRRGTPPENAGEGPRPMRRKTPPESAGEGPHPMGRKTPPESAGETPHPMGRKTPPESAEETPRPMERKTSPESAGEGPRPMGRKMPPEKAAQAVPLGHMRQGNGQIHNEVDMRMYHLLDEIGEMSEIDVTAHLKKIFSNLESRYQMVVSDYSRRFPYWGSFDPKKNDYSLFQNRAAQLSGHVPEMRWLYTVLSDYRSKKTFFALLDNWFSFNFKDIADVKEKIFEPYFDLDLIKCDKDEHYVDVGAYTGRTVEAFVRIFGQYGKISCYEITEKSFQTLKANIEDYDRADAYHVGAYDRDGQMFVKKWGEDASTNCLSDSGDEQVETATLDRHLNTPPTFLKIDAQGSEAEVIRGCTNLIRRRRPKLAVCADHSDGALWSLAKLITGIDARYRLYLRHYGGNLMPSEYVLFAV